MDVDVKDLPRGLNDDLEYDGDIRLLDGKPFSGIGYSEYTSGQLESENIYKDGLADGLQREWHQNGQLKKEGHAVRGLGSSKITMWYENGQIRSLALYEAGVKINYKEWDESGELLKDEESTPSPALKKYMDRIRKIK